MKILDLLKEAITNNLSDFQKGLLASITQSATANQAYMVASGSTNSMQALHQLQMMGFVVVHGQSVGLTTNGRAAAVQNNLIDPTTGRLTQEGQTQLNDYNKNKQEYVNASS